MVYGKNFILTEKDKIMKKKKHVMEQVLKTQQISLLPKYIKLISRDAFYSSLHTRT